MSIEPRAWSEADYPHQDLTRKIIAAANKVHEELGPGFVESIYQNAMLHQLQKAGLDVQMEVTVPVFFDGVRVGEHRIDLLVNNLAVVELKAVNELASVHEAQVKSTLKAADLELGLLMNFNVKQLTYGGLRRIICRKQ